jgi:putative polyketide hydroxylase
VLLAGRDGDAWRQAIHQIEPSWPPLIGFTVGGKEDLIDPDGNWHEAYGVETDGAVLVRPDGYVAWRGRSGASRPREVLRAVVDGVLGRIPQPALSAE